MRSFVEDPHIPPGLFTKLVGIAWLICSNLTLRAFDKIKANENKTDQTTRWAIELALGSTYFTSYKLDPHTELEGGQYTLHLGAEWVLVNQPGKLGVGLSGTYFKKSDYEDQNRQKWNLSAIPIEVFASYRFEFSPGQLMAPILKLGTGFTWFESSPNSHNAESNFSIDMGLLFGVGLQLLLNPFDKRLSEDVRLSIGARASYLQFMFQSTQSLGAFESDLTYYHFTLGVRLEI